MERYTRGRRHTAPRARVGRSVPRIGIVARWSDALAMSGQMDLRERFLAVPVVTRSLMGPRWWRWCSTRSWAWTTSCAHPHDIVRKGQIWRLALSLFYVPGLLNALIMSFVLYRLASAWEQERGSLRLAYYFFLGVVATNLGVCILAVVVAPVVPSVLSPAFLCGPGLLAAFLVLITRSSQGYAGASVNVLGLFAMPTLYFPLLLLVFFALFGANPLESAASVAVGYAWAQGYLDAVIPGDAALQAAERWPALRAVVAAERLRQHRHGGPVTPHARSGGKRPRGGARDRTSPPPSTSRRASSRESETTPSRGTGLVEAAESPRERVGDWAGDLRRGCRHLTSPTSRRISPPPPRRAAHRTSARAPTRTSRTYRVGHSGARRESVVDLRTAGRRRGRAQGRRSRRGRNAPRRLRWRTSDG